MAIIDLGKVSITWRGAYDGSTAYTPKDAVSYQNASYICTANTTGNLPTDTSYWNVMAAKGVDGTDVGTTLTTQGDILYRDGSGLQRLAAGTAGQALLTGGAGANPSWGSSGGLKKSVGAVKLDLQTINHNNGRTVISGLNLDFGSAVSSSNKLLIMGCIEYGYSGGDPGASFRWEYSADNSTWYGDKNLSTRQASGGGHAGSDANSNWSGGIFFGGTGVTIPTASVIHSATNQIIAVSALTVVPRYFRVTVRQTDSSNDDININFHDNTGGYAPTGNSTFNVIELTA